MEVTVYLVECAESMHGALAFSVRKDQDSDLIVTVDPCPDCVREAKEASE